MQLFHFAIISLFVALFLGAQPAMAFTTDDNSSYANSDGSSKFSDPDDQLDNITDANGKSQAGILPFGGGNSSFNFGVYQGDNSNRTTSAIQ